LSFYKTNRKIYDEITDALENYDIALAHRLVHSLKGTAQQIGKSILRKAAFDMEQNLKDGKNFVTQLELATLKIELDAVMLQLQTELAMELDGQI
jgi:HPt (histidine-containing phosphotransfer) domain-containing protein